MEKYKQKITFGISTITSRQQSAKLIANNVSLLFDEILIVVQGSEVEREDCNQNIRIIYTKELGLSRSRNLLLKRSSHPWLWINDDDVEILPNHVSVVRRNIDGANGNVALFTGRIGCIECNNLFKNYRYRWFSPLLFAQVSSVEMVVNRSWCNARNIHFDTEFGLGSHFPVAEEPIFASDIARIGGKIIDINHVIVNHPCNEVTSSSWKSWGNIGLCIARGKASARIGGWRGALFLIFSFSGALLRGRSLHAAVSILKGYWNHDDDKKSTFSA